MQRGGIRKVPIQILLTCWCVHPPCLATTNEVSRTTIWVDRRLPNYFPAQVGLLSADLQPHDKLLVFAPGHGRKI